MKVRFAEAARRDADEIFVYVAARDPKAAGDLLDRFEDAAADLADFPLVGRSARRRRRELTTVCPT